MTTETKPATDEEHPAGDGLIEELRRDGVRLFGADDYRFIRLLINRIDAERERAEKAEARARKSTARRKELRRLNMLIRVAHEMADRRHAWAQDAIKARDAERERAEKLKANAELLMRNLNWAADDKNALAAQLTEARQQITAERERAEKAEEEAETIGTLSRIARETSAAQLAEARQQIAALREARQVVGYSLANKCWWVKFYPFATEEEARAALAQTEGAE